MIEHIQAGPEAEARRDFDRLDQAYTDLYERLAGHDDDCAWRCLRAPNCHADHGCEKCARADEEAEA